MGFRINTNIAALNSHNNATLTNRMLDKSLGSLSSGLRINSAADDASGLVIADSLRSQANSLGQAVRNANDAIGIIQTADKAMDEQIKILDTIKTKAIQAASDTQNATSRAAIQSDVDRLIQQLDNIAKTTSFNGQTLLNGGYANKEYQVGAFSNQTIQASIGNTQSIAIGNVSSMGEAVQVGNTAKATLTASINEGTEKITLGDVLTGLNATGVAQGDTIRIDGLGDYKIENIEGSMSTGGAMSNAIITLDRGLEKTLTAGATFQISLMNTAAEDLSKVTISAVGTAAETITANTADITGFAIGDKIDVTTSNGETKTYTVMQVNGSDAATGLSGSLVLSSTTVIGTAGSLALGSAKMNDRSSLGTDFTSDDFLQYTIDGIDLAGVQLTTEVEVTDSDDATQTYAAGVAGTGLGRIADLVNATSAETGIKAVAVVEQNSSIRVQAGAVPSDIWINGVRVLDKGTSVTSGDSDNTLLNAINSSSNLTGVTASLEEDGSLTLKSDGRAIVTEGLSAVAGINDGVHAGVIEFTKLGGGAIDVESTHYKEAELVNKNGSGVTMEDITSTNVLSNLSFGSVDDNGDGIINGDDTIGLLRTREGATLAMDIVEAAINRLDSTRAGLGSAQNQLVVTVNNISVTQVNVKAAESQIRDVDFAAESSNFSRLNILAQSGSYALSQANAIQQNVLRLLQ